MQTGRTSQILREASNILVFGWSQVTRHKEQTIFGAWVPETGQDKATLLEADQVPHTSNVSIVIRLVSERIRLTDKTKRLCAVPQALSLDKIAVL